MHSGIKKAACSLGAVSGLFAWGRRMTRDSLRIFTYHGVERCHDPVLNFDRLQVDPELFERQVTWIASRFNLLSGSEFLRILLCGGAWPARAAMITFDDGYANNLGIAAPILKRLGVPAIVFVTTGFIEGTEKPWWYEARRQHSASNIQHPAFSSRHMMELIMKEQELVRKTRAEQEACLQVEESLNTKSNAPNAGVNWQPTFMRPADLAKLKDYNIEVGLHGHRHLACGVESWDDILDDLQICRQKLHEWSVQPLPVFAYPYGSIPPVADALGICAGLTTDMGINQPGSDPYFLRRFDVNGGRSVVNLAAVSSGINLSSLP